MSTFGDPAEQSLYEYALSRHGDLIAADGALGTVYRDGFSRRRWIGAWHTFPVYAAGRRNRWLADAPIEGCA